MTCSAGRAEAFYAHDVNVWDVLAGVVLVAEAGGHVARLEDGGQYSTDGRSIVATNGLIHADLMAAMRG